MLIEWKHFESILLKQKSYKNKLHKQKVILSRALTITTPPKNSLQLWLQSKTSLSVLFSCEGWTTPHFLIISAACTVTKVIVTDVTDLKLWVYLSHWRWTLRIWKTCKSLALSFLHTGMEQEVVISMLHALLPGREGVYSDSFHGVLFQGYQLRKSYMTVIV